MEAVEEDTFAHQYLKVLLYGFGLAWESDDEGLAALSSHTRHHADD